MEAQIKAYKKLPAFAESMQRIHFEKNISDPEPATFLHGNQLKISNKAPPNIIAKNESSAEWCDSLLSAKHDAAKFRRGGGGAGGDFAAAS